MADETFTGTDGEIATLTISIDGGVSNGNYAIFLKNMKLTETDISNYYETESIETTLTVGGTSYTILDETSTVAPSAENGVNVRVKRAIKANSWSTICLPFAIPAEKLTAAFGEGVQVKDFTSWSSQEDTSGNIVGITIGFSPVAAMEANHPYLIKVNSSITAENGFTVDDVDVTPTATPKKQVGTGKKKGVFYGTYVANTEVPEYNLFISSDRFYYSNGSTKMKAFRGYFDLYDYLTSLDEAGARISIIDNDATGIANVRTISAENSDYYDLLGRKVEDPRKGLYISNGRIVMKK